MGAASGKRLKGVFSGLLSLGTICMSLQVLAIVFGSLHPAIELATHFAFHGLVFLLIALPALVVFRKWRMSALATLCLGYLLLLVQPWNLYLRAPAMPPAEQSNSIKVLSWNMLAINRSFPEIESLIRETDADVLVLIETRPGLFEDLPFVPALYPLSQQYLNWNGSGICVFSRIPGSTFEFNSFGCERMPAIVMSIPATSEDSPERELQGNLESDDALGSKAKGSFLKLIALHTLSPIPVERTYGRDLQIETIANWAAQERLPLCVCGDFNTTPWTGAFQQLQAAGFVDSRRGAGNCPSWPELLGPLGLPIDHVLSKGACTVTQRRVLPRAAGSDHRPVVFRVHF